MAAKTTDPIDILLEMGIDLDNLSEEEDYLSALMEAANTLTIKDATDPRIVPLQQEILKLRKKRFAKARPEAKKTTIKPDAFFDKKKPEEQSQSGSGQKALPGQQTAAIVKRQTISPEVLKKPEEPEPEQEEKKKRKVAKSDPLKDILKGINTIIAILNQQQKLSAKQAEKDRKRAEKQKREGAENKLEDSGVKSFISGAAKLVKPVKGFLDGLFDFIKNVLIGTILIKIINWFTDPENQEKIDAIGDFFKNTWPALLAAYLLFGNSFGRFAVKLIKVVGGFVFKLASKIIPALITGIKRLGLGKSLALGGLAVGGAMLAGRLMDGGEDDVDLNQPDGKQKTPPPDKESEPAVIPAPAIADPPEPPTVSGRFDMESGQGYINDKPVSLEEYQTFQNMSNQEKVQKYGTGMKGGGMVPGRGPNKDTVPAMLAPGEFVMSRGAVQKYGADTMASMNAAGGGTNLPKRMNGVTYAAGGGGTNLPKRMNGVTYAAGGGMVPGSGPNRDTVPAMLAPGEFVVSRGAVQKYGADTFSAMNAAGGGTNLPKRMNGVTYAVGGGLMGDMSDYGYGDDKKEEPSPTVAKEMEERKETAQVEKEMKDREKISTTSENPVGNFFSGIGKALGFGGKKEEDKSKEDKSKEDEVQSSGGFNESSLKAAMDKAGYTDPTERAMFLAQMAHESGNFQYDEEIHDGSNYEGRSDLGNTQPGDGRRYKGRGYIQLTGRANYKHYGDKLGVDLENNPQLAKRPDIAAAVAVSYWNERVNRNAAREGDVRTVTYNINGGYNGLADREAKFKKYVGDPNYSAPGGGLKAPYSSPSGTTMASLGGSGSGGSRPGGGIATLFGNRTVTGGGSPSGTTMASLSKPFKAPPGPPPTPAPVGGSSGPTTGGSQQRPSLNRSAKQIKNQNSFPDIDANAMISMEKVKVLGLTLA